MRVRLSIEGTVLAATLEDTAVARDFASLLPLELTLEDYAATEKVADLPMKLSTMGSPVGTAGKTGDMNYYAPWGNLALFYRSAGYAEGLVRLGRFDASEGVDVLRRRGPLRAKIEIEQS